MIRKSSAEVAASAASLRRRRRALLGMATTSTLASVTGLLASAGVSSPAEQAARAAPPPPSVLTATVEKRVLTDTVVLRGEVVAAQSVVIGPRGRVGADTGAAGAVVTAVRVGNGDVVRSGHVMVEVSGRPVFALPGRIPAYRDLRPGARGDDITQLQAALRGAGLPVGGDPKGFFGEGTKRAVDAFYKKIGYSAPRTSGQDDQHLEAADTAVIEAQRRYDQLRTGSSIDSAGDPGRAADQARTPAAGERADQLRYAREDLERARRRLAAVRAETGPTVPASEVVFLQGLPGRVDRVEATVGEAVSERMLVVSAGRLLVKAKIKPRERALVKPGQPVDIAAELTATRATGKIDSVSDTPESTETEGAGEVYFPMRVSPSAPLEPRLAGQTVRLTVTAASTGGEVLVVPSSAVSAQANGEMTVTRRRPDGNDERVAVAAGTSGDGYVEIRPLDGVPPIAAGDLVVIGR